MVSGFSAHIWHSPGFLAEVVGITPPLLNFATVGAFLQNLAKHLWGALVKVHQAHGVESVRFGLILCQGHILVFGRILEYGLL